MCDLGANINLMPMPMFLKLGLRNPKFTTIMVQLVGCKFLMMLLKMSWFKWELEFSPYTLLFRILIHNQRSHLFIAIRGALIDVEAYRLKMRAHDKVEVIDVYKAMKLPKIYKELSSIITIDAEMTTMLKRNTLKRKY